VNESAPAPKLEAAGGPVNAVDYYRCRVGDADYLFAVAGRGDPVLLLHGFPQTHYCWRAIIPVLAHSHTVVAPDLRGYGAAALRLAAHTARVSASVRSLPSWSN
jgi:pimeloyl-ACP methyl ester carboxylesterase